MASRIQALVPRFPRPALRRPAIGVDPDAWRATLCGAIARVPRHGPPFWRMLWRALWLPFWVGSDVPAPPLPARSGPAPLAAGLAGEDVIRHLNALARRVWLQRAMTILVRSLWLAPAVGCFWLLLELHGGPAMRGDWLAALGVLFVALGILFAALVRPTRRQVARMLDRSFGLRERMTTAVDNLGRAVPQEGERASVIYLQMADAANVVGELRHHRAFALRPPVREIVLAVACGLLLASLFFFRGVGGGIPALASAPVPPFTPAKQRIAEQAARPVATGKLKAPTVKEVKDRAQKSNQAQRDLQTLGQALDDHAVTHDAAEAIQRGDYAAAAADLRTLADHADGLSPADRNALANDLDQAAGRMSPGDQQLSTATHQAAAGLRQGGQPAKDAVRKLGDAVQQTGSQVASQQDLANQMRQAEAAQGSQGAADQSSGGDQSGDQTGQPGDQGTQGQGQGQAQGSGQGQPGDPGNGFDAQPGNPNGADGQTQGGQPGANQGQQPGQRRGGQPNQGAQGGNQGGANGDQGNQAGAQPGAAGDAQQSGAGQNGNQSGDQAQQGAGAGGQSQTGGGQNQNQTGAQPNGNQPGSQGAPAQERVTKPQPSTPPNSQGTTPATNDTLQLDQTGGQGVQTGEDTGSSSLGSGAGVTAASGSATQGAVGPAGPDSNRVPAEYRTVVEQYFSDPSGGS